MAETAQSMQQYYDKLIRQGVDPDTALAQATDFGRRSGAEVVDYTKPQATNNSAALKKIAGDTAKNYAKDEIIDYGSSLFSSGEAAGVAKTAAENAAYNQAAMDSILASGSNASGVATTAEANAAYNAAATGGEALAETAATEAGMFDLAGIGSAGNVILPALGAYGAYNLATTQGDMAAGSKRDKQGAMQGAASGAMMGSYFGPWGALAGGIIGGVAGFAGSEFGSSKGERQMKRDNTRKALQNMGVLDENWGLTLADGSKYNMGLDGGARFQNKGINIDGRTDRQASDVDFSDPTSHQTVGWANPLAAILAGGDKQAAEDLAGQFTNAAQSNAGGNLEAIRKNLQAIYKSYGIDNDQAISVLKGMKDQKNLSEDEYNAAVYGLGTMSAEKPPKLEGAAAPQQKLVIENANPALKKNEFMRLY